MMNKEFVPYEIALALKELGFDEPCFAHYCNGDLITKTAILKSSTMLYYQQNNINPNNQYKHQNCTAPLKQQAFRWFREKHGYYCEPFVDDDKTFGFLISSFVEMGRLDQPLQRNYLTPEEAELECIKKLIELCKKN